MLEGLDGSCSASRENIHFISNKSLFLFKCNFKLQINGKYVHVSRIHAQIESNKKPLHLATSATFVIHIPD
jgi:hypothetical protein